VRHRVALLLLTASLGTSLACRGTTEPTTKVVGDFCPAEVQTVGRTPAAGGKVDVVVTIAKSNARFTTIDGAQVEQRSCLTLSCTWPGVLATATDAALVTTCMAGGTPY
jgi:hypothetical protein